MYRERNLKNVVGEKCDTDERIFVEKSINNGYRQRRLEIASVAPNGS
jgi:hypothetical protein